MPADIKDSLIRALWRAQMHTEPGALERSPRRVQARFEHAWAPAEFAMSLLHQFPEGWLRLWAEAGRGHLVFTHEPSRYAAGPQPWRDATLDGVAYLSLTDLAEAPNAAWVALLHLHDHLLGSGARGGSACFSDGAGPCPALEEAAQRFLRYHELGYGHRILGADTARDYFARSLLLFLEDAPRLNTLDPLVERLYALTLWQDAFWRRVRRELAQASGEATRS